jgi:hypothetical protein
MATVLTILDEMRAPTPLTPWTPTPRSTPRDTPAASLRIKVTRDPLAELHASWGDLSAATEKYLTTSERVLAAKRARVTKGAEENANTEAELKKAMAAIDERLLAFEAQRSDTA